MNKAKVQSDTTIKERQKFRNDRAKQHAKARTSNKTIKVQGARKMNEWIKDSEFFKRNCLFVRLLRFKLSVFNVEVSFDNIFEI